MEDTLIIDKLEHKISGKDDLTHIYYPTQNIYITSSFSAALKQQQSYCIYNFVSYLTKIMKPEIFIFSFIKTEKYSIERTAIFLHIDFLWIFKNDFLRLEAWKWNYCQSIFTSLWLLILIAKMLSKNGCNQLNGLQYQYQLQLYLDL